MDPLHTLQHRRSTPSRLLREPGPDAGQLQRLLACAIRVPDHGRLEPWRFVLIRGEQRALMGSMLAARTSELHPDAAPAVIDKDRNRFNSAPLIVTVIARPSPGHKIPEQEQLSSGAAVCLQLLQAADALGFGAQWLTGWAAYDGQVHAALGLQAHERILGFIHIGTASEPAPERERPELTALLTELKL